MKTLARESDRAEIVRRLRSVHPESVRRWGGMTAHQMVCHLTDSLYMMTGERSVSDRTGVLQKTILKWIVLYAPVAWPTGVPTRPEIDQEAHGTRPGDFVADVGSLESLLDGLVSRTKSFDGRLHPIFGRMSQAAWLRWAYLHMDHHLRQFGA